MHSHYHFIGIGGIGMGTLACLVLDKGGRVSGSDVKENNMTRRLREKGAKVFIGHKGVNIGTADCVVYSSAIKNDNPEIISARENDIPVLQRGQLLAELMENQVSITVSGMHGKTTTTSMVSSVLVHAGFKPTTAVGGIIPGNVSHAALGQGKYFVAELDESDGSFLYFRPVYSIITNIDLEHIDYYLNWETILGAYSKFIDKTRDEGLVIACGDNAPLKDLVLKSGRRHMFYGLGRDNNAFAENIFQNGYNTRFDCVLDSRNLGQVRLNVPGEHNIVNALSAVCLGVKLGIDIENILQSLALFSGVERRFQNKGKIDGVQVIDDYGHHPTEITATLRAARSFSPGRVITVFQPHRYSRMKFLMDDFVNCLSLSDYVIITDIYAASETPIEGISSQVITSRFLESGNNKGIYLKKGDIVGHLLEIVSPGDLVITLGAGDIYRVGEEFVSALSVRMKEKEHLSK